MQQNIETDLSQVAAKTPSNESASQYQIRPSIGKSLPIAGIREIINEVLLQILDGKKLIKYKN